MKLSYIIDCESSFTVTPYLFQVFSFFQQHLSHSLRPFYLFQFRNVWGSTNFCLHSKYSCGWQKHCLRTNRAYLLCQHFMLSASTYLVFNLCYSWIAWKTELDIPSSKRHCWLKTAWLFELYTLTFRISRINPKTDLYFSCISDILIKYWLTEV